ncbi:hypothetical protein Tco_0925084 [Tanacetum coccineum]|uniref:Homologous recombination OB-fold protein OB-fold domain-containing protein n=1 Tax=Tanacetum coccineum TaxID=301880 RepID=A0ABQ5D5V2_9ASTR
MNHNTSNHYDIYFQDDAERYMRGFEAYEPVLALSNRNAGGSGSGSEQLLDIDDFDLPLTPVLRPYNNHVRKTTITTKNPDVDNLEEKLVSIIPGPTGIVQATKLRKQSDIHECRDESVLSTQEYIRKVVEDVGEDEDFKGGSWVNAVEFVIANWGIVNGCFGDMKDYLKNRKLEQVVAIIKSCAPNALGDLTVALKDISGTISSTIHHKSN